MRPPAALLCLPTLFLILAGCDALPVDPDPDLEVDLCPSPLSAEGGDHFPLELGETWAFDYAYRNASQGGRQEVAGTLTWATTAIGECEGDRRVYTVDEELEGTRTSISPFGTVVS
jgi:hypothetical protein